MGWDRYSFSVESWLRVWGSGFWVMKETSSLAPNTLGIQKGSGVWTKESSFCLNKYSTYIGILARMPNRNS